jgi:hypothetical protein
MPSERQLPTVYVESGPSAFGHERPFRFAPIPAVRIDVPIARKLRFPRRSRGMGDLMCPGPSLVSEPKRLLASLLLACVGQSCVSGSYFERSNELWNAEMVLTFGILHWTLATTGVWLITGTLLNFSSHPH